MIRWANFHFHCIIVCVTGNIIFINLYIKFFPILLRKKSWEPYRLEINSLHLNWVKIGIKALKQHLAYTRSTMLFIYLFLIIIKFNVRVVELENSYLRVEFPARKINQPFVLEKLMFYKCNFFIFTFFE